MSSNQPFCQFTCESSFWGKTWVRLCLMCLRSGTPWPSGFLLPQSAETKVETNWGSHSLQEHFVEAKGSFCSFDSTKYNTDALILTWHFHYVALQCTCGKPWFHRSLSACKMSVLCILPTTGRGCLTSKSRIHFSNGIRNFHLEKFPKTSKASLWSKLQKSCVLAPHCFCFWFSWKLMPSLWTNVSQFSVLFDFSCTLVSRKSGGNCKHQNQDNCVISGEMSFAWTIRVLFSWALFLVQWR